MNIGVPKGSMLGPILFCFINDLVNVASMIDYNTICRWHKYFIGKGPLLLKSNLKNIEEWCLADKLTLNYTFQVVFKALY